MFIVSPGGLHDLPGRVITFFRLCLLLVQVLLVQVPLVQVPLVQVPLAGLPLAGLRGLPEQQELVLPLLLAGLRGLPEQQELVRPLLPGRQQLLRFRRGRWLPDCCGGEVPGQTVLRSWVERVP